MSTKWCTCKYSNCIFSPPLGPLVLSRLHSSVQQEIRPGKIFSMIGWDEFIVDQKKSPKKECMYI